MTRDIHTKPQLPKDFYVNDLKRVLTKLQRLAQDGPERLHCVFDFDHTLTAGKRPGENVGTWDIIDELLPEEGRKRHQEIFQAHRPHELAGKLTVHEAQGWWSETLNVLCSYNFNMRTAENDFLEAVTLRSGVTELFHLCDTAGIPTIVLSAGTKDVIELLLEKYHLKASAILATELEITPEGRVLGWKHDTLIHMLNKHEMGHAKLAGMREQRPNIILLADGLDDVRMVEGVDDVLRIRVVDPRKDESSAIESYLEKSFEAGFDLVIEHDLLPVVRLTEQLLGTHK
jgi:phosphoserine phosphatase